LQPLNALKIKGNNMPFTADINNLPSDIQEDINNGFILTDIDDRYQRCQKVGETTFLYRSGTADQNFLCELTLDEREKIENIVEESINVSELSNDNISEALSGYYDSEEALVEECGRESANMLIAECYFESEIDYLR
jgi:hypothetical protein